MQHGTGSNRIMWAPEGLDSPALPVLPPEHMQPLSWAGPILCVKFSWKMSHGPGIPSILKSSLQLHCSPWQLCTWSFRVSLQGLRSFHTLSGLPTFRNYGTNLHDPYIFASFISVKPVAHVWCCPLLLPAQDVVWPLCYMCRSEFWRSLLRFLGSCFLEQNNWTRDTWIALEIEIDLIDISHTRNCTGTYTLCTHVHTKANKILFTSKSFNEHFLHLHRAIPCEIHLCSKLLVYGHWYYFLKNKICKRYFKI